MIEIVKVSPVHKQGTVGEYAYVYARLQDRDFMWSHVSQNRFGVYFPPLPGKLTGYQEVPIRILIDHHLKAKIVDLPARSAKAFADLVIKDVARHLAGTMPSKISCTCSLHGRVCGVGEFLVEGQIVSST